MFVCYLKVFNRREIVLVCENQADDRLSGLHVVGTGKIISFLLQLEAHVLRAMTELAHRKFKNGRELLHFDSKKPQITTVRRANVTFNFLFKL